MHFCKRMAVYSWHFGLVEERNTERIHASISAQTTTVQRRGHVDSYGTERAGAEARDHQSPHERTIEVVPPSVKERAGITAGTFLYFVIPGAVGLDLDESTSEPGAHTVFNVRSEYIQTGPSRGTKLISEAPGMDGGGRVGVSLRSAVYVPPPDMAEDPGSEKGVENWPFPRCGYSQVLERAETMAEPRPVPMRRPDGYGHAAESGHDGRVNSGLQHSLRCRVASGYWTSLLLWADHHLLFIRAAHVPGCLNSSADMLSRDGIHHGEWRLNPRTVRLIWEWFRKTEVDLFAMEENTHCPLFFSLSKSPLGEDALTML